jgi:serine/threonine protein kinase
MADDPNAPGPGNPGPDIGDDDLTQYLPADRKGGASNADDSGATLAPGSLLSHTYRIERLLARGGMGEVYRAQHVEMGTWHAIKIILPELVGDAKIVDLFRREAGVLRNIRHDAIVAYDGVFRDEQGRVYLVMEFVDGPSLSEIMKHHKLAPEEVRTLRDRLASGLATAHETGVIHRDMSPDNIILQGGHLRDAKIIDFGIAKLADPGQATIIGDEFAGKLSYVSPEQLGMFGGAVDARSDIYSLGLILAAAATGRRLNMGDSPMAVLEARKSVPDLGEVPDELRDELAAMLQPDPADRAQTMRVLISETQAAPTLLADAPAPWETDGPAAAGKELDESATAASLGSVPPPARKPETRRSKAPLFATLIGLVALAGAGYGGYVMFLASPPPPAQPAPVAIEPTAPAVPESPAPAQPATVVPIPDAPAVTESPPPAPSTTVATVPDAPAATESPPPAPSTTVVTAPAAPAVTESPPPAPSTIVATAPTAPTEIPDLPSRNRAVNLALRDITCGNVGGAFGDGDVLRLIGHLSSEAARQALHARLKSVSGVALIDDHALVIVPEPGCGIVDALPAVGLSLSPDQAAEAAELGKPAHAGTLNFRAGELLTLVRIGGTEKYAVTPTEGLDLVVTVGSSVPLFEGVRPEVEPADAYLASLLQALRSARAREATFRGEYSYLFVGTTP